MSRSGVCVCGCSRRWHRGGNGVCTRCQSCPAYRVEIHVHRELEYLRAAASLRGGLGARRLRKARRRFETRAAKVEELRRG